jgi:hypothetical protein
VLRIPARTPISQLPGCHRGQAKGVVQFAKQQQAAI